ncbi:hypothetical protein BH10PLA2_BH10PLA2_36700 [soil metagenome]
MATIQEVESRLGHPRMLAQVAADEHRSSYFVGRHPIWCCVVAPIPLVIACFAICMLAVVGCGQLAEWLLGKSFGMEGKSADEWPAFAVTIAHGVVYFLRFVPPVLATLIVCWKVRQAGLSAKWLWISFCPIGLLAVCFFATLQLPQTSGSGSLIMSLNFPVHTQSLIQAALPLVMVGLLAFSNRKRSMHLPVVA